MSAKQSTQYAPLPIYDDLEQQQYQHYPQEQQYIPVLIPQQDEGIPVGVILFIIGFFFPIAWLIGACCDIGPRTQKARMWKKLNAIMALLCVMSSVVFLLIFVIVPRIVD